MRHSIRCRCPRALLNHASQAAVALIFLTVDPLQCVQAQTEARGAPKAQLDTSEFKRLMQEEYESVESLRVGYDVPYAAGDAYPGAYVHREILAKAPDSLRYDLGHGLPYVPWQAEPFREVVYVNPPSEYVVSPNNRTYSHRVIAHGSRLPGKLHVDLFLLCTGLWPLTGTPTPRPFGRAHTLAEVAQQSDYQLRSELELVGGHWCHVLVAEPHDCLWIDHKRGYCLVRRELRDDDSRVLIRTTLGGHSKAPGPWVPRWIRHAAFEMSASPAAHPTRKLYDLNIDVDFCAVNDVISDAVFHYTPPAGALKYDGSGGSSPIQTHPGGQDHLDRLADWLVEYSDKPVDADAHQMSSAILTCLLLGLLAPILFVISQARRGTKSRAGVVAPHRHLSSS